MTTTRIDISIKNCDRHDGHWCSFGNHGRRPQGEFVFIEKVDGEWPEWAVSEAAVVVLDDRISPRNRAVAILDALSDHTEGT